MNDEMTLTKELRKVMGIEQTVSAGASTTGVKHC